MSLHGYTMDAAETIFDPETEKQFEFRIRDSSGETVTVFDERHEQSLHLIVIRRDLVHFQHLHPTLSDDGRCSVPLALPAAGFYRAFADFVVKGKPMTLGIDLASPGHLRLADNMRAVTKASSGPYHVSVDASALEVGEPGTLTCTVNRNGTPLEDLGMYLGALGHLVAVREGDLAYLHVHPKESADSGPHIAFNTAFPSPGRYRLFLQFNHDGKIRTVDFTIEVPR